MFSQVGACKYGEDGVLKSGIIVRHLVLPSCRTDSINVLGRISEMLPKNDILVSIMSQYTPEFAGDCTFKELKRRVTSFEYDCVLREAERLGLSGFSQSRSSASGSYTPNFKDSKI